MTHPWISAAIVLLGCSIWTSTLSAEPAFSINGKVTDLKTLEKEEQAAFYDLAKKKYDLIQEQARTKYLDAYWAELAKKKGLSVEAARKEYFDKNVKITDKEIKETLERFKSHPQLSSLSKEEQDSQIRNFLVDGRTRELVSSILDAALKSGKLKLLFPEPEEPVYKVVVNSDDHVRYGPKDADTKPMGCKGDKCQITVVEYSEFECPFCKKVLPDVKRLMTEYKGKIRWIVRDFPLSFHKRAKPAAIAAKCAAYQGKYWEMYSALFDNQKALGDSDLESYAKKIKLDMKKYNACVKSPKKALAVIEKNTARGAELGLTGTPAFFINGRRLVGAMPYGEFKRIIEDELKKQKKGA